MRGCWLSLLLVSAVTLHGCLSAELDVQEEISIRSVVNLYNMREGVTYLYKCLDELPSVPLQDGGNPNRRGIIIKETECLKSENPDLSQCDFKQDGEVKICALDLDDDNPEGITCVSLTRNIQVRRSENKTCTKGLCKLLKGAANIIGSVIQKKVNLVKSLLG